MSKNLGRSGEGVPLLLILALSRSFLSVRERLEKERKQLLRRLNRSLHRSLASQSLLVKTGHKAKPEN